MRNTPDPAWHQAREQEITRHVEHLLREPKWVIDTALGRRVITSMKQQVTTGDKAVELKRQMAQIRPDRTLEAQMPVGRTLEATLSVNKWIVFQNVIGRLMLVVHPPTKELLKDENPAPLTLAETRRQIMAVPPSLPGVPTTLVLVSTSGFEFDARELAERTSERIIVLVEPNEAGGWTIHGSTEMGAGVLDLLDPETLQAKEDRVATAIELSQDDLLTGSLSADKIALLTQLPLQRVEDAVKSYAKKHAGLIAKRLDGRLLIYREGTNPSGRAVGGENMSLLDRIKTLFNRKGDHERKIAFLSERRAALTNQRDTSHDELFKLEKRESDLKKEFKANDSPTARRRVTAQLVQLRKEIDRRSQLMGVLNQQINVVSTHLHNLELLNQGRAAQLPNSEEIASDAAAAEEMLATLQADSEMADTLGASTNFGASSEEQALYDEMMAELGEPPAADRQPTDAAPADRTDTDREPPTTNPPRSTRTATGEPG
ncbi:MAG TPA: hypothetical protein VGB55_01770 [Tepidisphaeraceae bacterium]|jgi:hypothetical protein